MSVSCKLGVILVLFLQFSFGESPKLVPRVLRPEEHLDASFWLDAPIIAIATIRSSSWTGPEVPLEPGLAVRLSENAATIETVLRGAIPTGSVTFYCFTNTLTDSQHVIRMRWDPGRRYLLFLRRESGQYRVLTDWTSLQVKITAESPYLETLRGSETASTLGISIARAALAPGKPFNGMLQILVDQLKGFAPASEMVTLLRSLLASADPRTRIEACQVVSTYFNYRDPCLPETIRSLGSRSGPVLSSRLNAGPDLVNRLRRDPFSLSISGKVEDLHDDLTILMMDFDPAVRREACNVLVRVFGDHLECTK